MHKSGLVVSGELQAAFQAAQAQKSTLRIEIENGTCIASLSQRYQQPAISHGDPPFTNDSLRGFQTARNVAHSGIYRRHVYRRAGHAGFEHQPELLFHRANGAHKMAAFVVCSANGRGPGQNVVRIESHMLEGRLGKGLVHRGLLFH
jgi:hypothetical protein